MMIQAIAKMKEGKKKLRLTSAASSLARRMSVRCRMKAMAVP